MAARAAIHSTSFRDAPAAGAAARPPAGAGGLPSTYWRNSSSGDVTHDRIGSTSLFPVEIQHSSYTEQ